MPASLRIWDVLVGGPGVGDEQRYAVERGVGEAGRDSELARVGEKNHAVGALNHKRVDGPPPAAW